MNNESNSNAGQSPEENQPQGAANSTPPPAGHCVFEPLRSAMSEGTHRAKVAAEKAVPKIKAAVSGATYWLGFGVCFATVFSYSVLKELAPDALKGGCRDGARAGQKNAEDLASKFKTQWEGPAATTGSATA